MEGRPPFDPDDDLDFDFDSPRRRQAERQQQPERDTGERPRFEDEAPDQPDQPPSEEVPAEGSPYDTDSDPYGEPPSSTEYSTSGEYPAADPFDTSERRVRRREPKRRGLRLPWRRSRGRERSAPASETGERPRVADEPPTTGERPPLSDDPFESAAAAAARRERRHHRDLPAKVRRRQAAGIGAIALVVLLGAFFLLKGGGGDGDEEEPLAVKRLVGQTIIGKLPAGGPDKDMLRRIKKGQLGGVIAVRPDEQTLPQQVAQMQNAAEAGGSPPVLVMIDQEGGSVKRLPGPPDVAPSSLGDTGDPDAAKTVGEDTGNYLKGFGVNVNLAPVMDVSLPQTADTIADRTYSDDPAVVSEIGSAFIEGMQSAGVAATAKHFPGLGPATVNTDFAPTTIAARDDVLAAALAPFQAAVDAKVELVMVASATYPSYGPENPKDPNKPANSVKAIVQKQLRENLGFQGLVITDDLESIAIETLTSPAAAGVAALGAGCDLILYAKSNGGSEQALSAAAKAVKQEKLSRDAIQASYDRILSLKARLDPGGD